MGILCMRHIARPGLGSSGMANSSLNGVAFWEALICISSAGTASAKALRQVGGCLHVCRWRAQCGWHERKEEGGYGDAIWCCRAFSAIVLTLAFHLGERRGHWIVLSRERTKYAYWDHFGFCVEKSLKRDKGASKGTVAVFLVRDRVGLNQNGEN